MGVTETDNHRDAGNHYLQAAIGLHDLMVREGDVTDQLGTMSPAAFEALRDSKLFWMCVPTEMGGGGCNLTDMMAVIETVATADGSIAWSLMANLSETAMAAVYLGDDAVSEMFGGSKMAICAGMFGAGGKAVEVAGGLQGGGKYAFGSGMAHADWIGSGMLVMENGAPRPLASGAPEIQVCFVPTSKVDIIKNWQVSGLVGTGSYDYLIPDQFIASGFSFERNINTPKRGNGLFRLGMLPPASVGHAGVVLGLMKHALAEVAELAAIKKRPGATRVVAEEDIFRDGFAQNEALYQASRDFAYRAYRDAEEAALSGGEITPLLIARVRQATIWLHQVGSQVVQFCHLWSGSEAIRPYTAMGRVSRDMAVASQHIVADPIAMPTVARPILDAWRKD